MEATGVYPNSAPVLAANGLGVALAGTDPDQVPLQPDLINDPRRRFAPDGSAVDARGVMRLHVRNALGYAFLRPHERDKLRLLHSGRRRSKEQDWMGQASFYRRNYRHFVPHDLLMNFLEHECPPQEDGHSVSKWQGNAIAGVDCGQDGHVVFYPTGQVLQQACAWYSKGESEVGPPCLSTVVETGSTIRQFAVMGSKDAYHTTSAAKIYAAARGRTNCTIIAAPARVTTDNMHKMQAKAKISFPGMINHVAGSPHAEAEVALITADGVVRWWEPEAGIQTANKEFMNTPNRFLRCEYSSHPCVLWSVNRATVSTLDLRQPPQHTSTLFDVSSAGSFITVYDLKRRSSNPFQFVVGTSVSVELLDSRMARQPLVSWNQPQSYSSQSEISFGAIDEVNLSRNANDERGYIASSSTRPKVTTLFPFERNRKRRRGKVLSLASLRSSVDDEYSETPRSSTEQIIASDATLDLHMEDGGESTSLTGICALRDEDFTSASIYQLNSLGDLYSHRVSFSRPQTKSYRAAVQPDLPCGVTAHDDSADESISRTLPIPLDAILPENDTESMQVFTTLPIKVLRRQFPRLPEDTKPQEHENVKNVEAEPTPISNTPDKKGVKQKVAIIGKRLLRIMEKEERDRKANSVVEKEESQGKPESVPGKDSRSRNSDESDCNEHGTAKTKIAGERRSWTFDKGELVDKLLQVCDPSASLFRLHRYVLDDLDIELSPSKLLQLLRSSSEFRIRTVHHAFPADTFRVHDPSASGADIVHRNKDDPRLATCACRPGSPHSQLPCESWSCVVPHAVILSSTSDELRFDDSAPSSAVRQEIPQDFADVIAAAQAVYDDMYESE